MRYLRPIVFAGVLGAATGPANAAPVQWTVGAGGNDHWYEVVFDTASGWNAANAAAVGAGGYLVSVLSAAEQSFIVANLLTGAPYGSYWIGLTDASSERGTSTTGWTWSSGEPYAYHFFATLSGQPDNNSTSPFGDGADGEDYVQIVWRPDGAYPLQGAWNDVREAGHEFAAGSGLTHLNRQGYIVEYQQNPVVPVPAAAWLFGSALLGLSLARRR